MSTGTRGKWAEAEVAKHFGLMSGRLAGFTFNRIPDARGGYHQPAAADFQWFYRVSTAYFMVNGVAIPAAINGLLEVKEVEHLYRLPHKNFDAAKRGLAYVRQMAGCKCSVIIAHKLSGMQKKDVTWRTAPLDYFRNPTPSGTGSWDLSALPLMKMEDILEGLLK